MGARWDGRPCQECGRRKTPRRRLAKHCATCDRKLTRARQRQAYGQYLTRQYGITIEEYEQILAAQGGKCFICRVARGRTRRLSVDHDHALGSGRNTIRALLCRPCNTMLGRLRDDPDAFLRAVTVLRDRPAQQVLSAPTMGKGQNSRP